MVRLLLLINLNQVTAREGWKQIEVCSFLSIPILEDSIKGIQMNEWNNLLEGIRMLAFLLCRHYRAVVKFVVYR
jgi:hypothetical protein